MLLATQAAGLIETNVANSAGSASPGPLLMNNAWLIFMLPHGIIAVSIVTAFYTRMAEHAHGNDIASFRTDFSSAARSILLLITFCAAALIVVAFPLSRIFTPDYTQLGFILIGYLIGLVPFSLVFMSQRAFYSLGDTRTPFFFTLAQVAVIVVGVLLCFMVAPDFRAAAIALVVSVAGGIQAIIAVALLRRRIGGVDGRRIASGLWRFLGRCRRLDARRGGHPASARRCVRRGVPGRPDSSRRSCPSRWPAWSCSPSMSEHSCCCVRPI